MDTQIEPGRFVAFTTESAVSIVEFSDDWIRPLVDSSEHLTKLNFECLIRNRDDTKASLVMQLNNVSESERYAVKKPELSYQSDWYSIGSIECGQYGYLVGQIVDLGSLHLVTGELYKPEGMWHPTADNLHRWKEEFQICFKSNNQGIDAIEFILFGKYGDLIDVGSRFIVSRAFTCNPLR